MFSKILPLCLGKFEAYPNRCSEYNLGRNSFRISKLDINHHRPTPFPLAYNWIQIRITGGNENTTWQWDGKGRHIDCHHTSIDGNSPTGVKFFRGRHKIDGPILHPVLRSC
jgi:hypothetical protein